MDKVYVNGTQITQIKQIFTDFYFLFYIFNNGVRSHKKISGHLSNLCHQCAMLRAYLHTLQVRKHHTVSVTSVTSSFTSMRSNFVSVRAVWMRFPG